MRAFWLTFFLCSHTLISVAASDKNKQLNQVQGNIKSVEKNISQLKKNQDKASSALMRIEQKQGKITHALQALTKQMRQKQQRINEIEQDSQLQNGNLLMQQEQLARQVKSAYALGRQEQLKLLFNQQDSRQSSRMMTYYQYFNRAKLQRLTQINSDIQQLSVLNQQSQLEKQQLAELVSKNKVQQNQLTKSKKERKTILAKINRDYQKNISQLSRLKKNEQQLIRLITSLQQAKREDAQPLAANQPFQHLKGKLPWPVKGKILHSFGSSRSGSRWNGVLIKASEGTEIKAIAQGQVIFSNWLKGYGLLVIVRHDKKYVSLYAYNQSLYKEVGDRVDTGDILATAGSSGGREKAGLYFEIRNKDKPLNPRQWCQ